MFLCFGRWNLVPYYISLFPPVISYEAPIRTQYNYTYNKYIRS